jgi:hypothetical protein
MKTIRINNVNDLLNAVYATEKKFIGQHLWWRGQSRSDWDVGPQIYQKELYANEHNMTLLFLNKAKIRHEQCPAPEDRAAWLFLMQHYGLPTRLLNWSESILVAAYFAVSEKKNMAQAGALWGLEPTLLNEAQLDRKGLIVHEDEGVQEIFNAAFRNDNSHENGEGKTVAILTGQLDIRQVVQFSAFTIHGSSVPINRMEGANKYLVKYEIPAGAKPGMLQALELLGIRRSFLFPDLEHLVADVQSIEFDASIDAA